uniref:Uncharacterized protein n=1 Tax=Anguilla anguilla TaxID=7936 RepID=A0A0E9S9E6_ANGAN
MIVVTIMVIDMIVMIMNMSVNMDILK